MAAKVPPASISGSWRGSPTRTSLARALVGGVDEAGEVAGADHGGFVDDEHGAFVEEGPAGVEDADDAVDGLGRDAGAGLELGRGAGRERGADDRVAVVVVGVVGARRARWSCPRRLGRPPARSRHPTRPPVRSGAAARRPAAAGPRSAAPIAVSLATPMPVVQPLGGDVDGVGFEGEDLRRRVHPREPFDRLTRGEVPVGAIQDRVEPRRRRRRSGTRRG